jgi:hypothetical protein
VGETTTQRPRRQEAEPATTEITEVAPNILRSQLPIMLPGLGHVNCYSRTSAASRSSTRACPARSPGALSSTG